MQVNLDLHPELHQVFNFAENTESIYFLFLFFLLLTNKDGGCYDQGLVRQGGEPCS